jgi:ribosomal protein L24
MSNLKTKLKTGDKVKVITGKYKWIYTAGSSGGKKEKKPLIDYISHFDLKNQTVYLKKASRKKYDKSTAETKKKSELKEIMVPIHISNVAYWLEDKKKVAKIGFRKVEEKKGEKTKLRIARKFKDKQGSNLLID